MRKLALLAALILALGACSDDTSESDNSANGSTNNNVTDPFISGSVTGDVTSELALIGVFKCEAPVLATDSATAEIIGTGDGNSEQVSIRIPYADGGVGSYDLIGPDDEPATTVGRMEISYRGDDLTKYESGAGTLEITSWPVAGGESVEGTFTATLTDGTGMIMLDGTISGEAIAEGFDDCTQE